MTQKLVSVRQLQMLVEFMKKHKDLATGRVRSKEGRAKSAKLWSQLANLLNPQVSVKNYRSPKEWNRFYNDYKCRVRSKARKIKMSQDSTPGEPSDIVSLTPIEEMLCEIITTDRPDNAGQYNPIEEIQIEGYKCEPIDEDNDLEQSSLFEAEQTTQEEALERPIPIQEQSERKEIWQHNNKEKLRCPSQTPRETLSPMRQNEVIEGENTKSFVQATLEMETEKIKVDRERNAIELQKTNALNNIASALWAISKSLKKRRRNSVDSSEED